MPASGAPPIQFDSHYLEPRQIKMPNWLRRLRGAIGTGATWAVAWALSGLLIGISSVLLPFLPWHLFFDFFDAPLPALAIPGFVGGAIFSAVLGVAARRRSFEELSLPRFAALGAVGGLLLSLLPIGMLGFTAASLARPGLWLFVGLVTVLSAGSAAGSLALARMAGEPGRIGTNTPSDRLGPDADAARRLSGGG